MARQEASAARAFALQFDRKSEWGLHILEAREWQVAVLHLPGQARAVPDMALLVQQLEIPDNLARGRQDLPRSESGQKARFRTD